MRSSFSYATAVMRIASLLLCFLCTSVVADGMLTTPAQAQSPGHDSNKHLLAQNSGSALIAPADINNDNGLSPEQIARRKMRRRMRREALQNGGDPAGSGTTSVGAGGSFGAAVAIPAVPGESGVGISNAGGAFGGGRKFGGGFGAGRRQLGAGRGGGLGGGLGGGNLFGKRALDLTSLNLSPDQKQRIQEMRKQVAPKTRDLRKQLVAKRMELRDMMFEANAGDDQVRAKRKEVRQLQDKIEDLQINDFLAIRSVLTPDQRQKLTDLKPGPKISQTRLIAPAVATP